MPIIKSAKKRVRVTTRATERNRTTRNLLRSSLKNFVAAVKSGKKVADTHAEAQSALDMAAKKGIIHKNKAARKKAQLARAMKAAGGKVEKSAKPASAKKASPAKAPVKKAVAKKPAAKKAAPKK